MGRYVDPVDCRIMHERHAVYRLESSSGWRLQPPTGQPEILLGPLVGLRRAEYHPDPVPGELGQQLNETRHNAQLAYQTTDVLKQQIADLTQRLNDNVARQNQNNDMIAAQIRELRERLEKTQGGSGSATPAPSPSQTGL
jgi:hypothetical protein